MPRTARTVSCHYHSRNLDYWLQRQSASAAGSRKKPRSHDSSMSYANRRTTMGKDETTAAGFPGIAFATLPDTGETIAIRYGERLYYRVDSTKTADELN